MAKFKRKSITVDAVQWFKLHDHPDVEDYGPAFIEKRCGCGNSLALHGWLFSEKGGKVCPGDWIVTEATGKVKRYKENEFKENYELILATSEINSSKPHDDSTVPVLNQEKVKKYLEEFRTRPFLGDKIKFENIKAPKLGTTIILEGKRYKVINISQFEDNFDIEIESANNG